MKISDIITENRSLFPSTYGVITEVSPKLSQRLVNDSNIKRVDMVFRSMEEVSSHYNGEGTVSAKLKKNTDSDDRFHYHIGFPEYTLSPASDYYTSDWVVLFKIIIDHENETAKILFYRIGHHKDMRRWNDD